MREVLKTFFVPRTHWAATNVNLVPTVAHGAQLARWGGVGVFGAFWMIGDNAFAWAKSFVVDPPTDEN